MRHEPNLLFRRTAKKSLSIYLYGFRTADIEIDC
jgi:hypothetical protein